MTVDLLSFPVATDTIPGIVELATAAETETGLDTTRAVTPADGQATYVKKSLIDAAGDLIYGTAADTAARLGIGTAGQVLRTNSAATAPVWGNPYSSAVAAPMKVGIYYSFWGTHQGSFGLTKDTEVCTPFLIGRPCTLSGIVVRHTANGAAGAVYRLGIRNDDGGYPGSVLLDAGTVVADAGAAVNREKTISLGVEAQLVWLSCTLQVAAGASAHCMSISNLIGVMGQVAPAFAYPSAYVQTGVVGALGGFTATPATTNVAPEVWLVASA